MKVHLMNCATMRSGPMVAACLLIETNQGLVLVDTALGQWCHNHPIKTYGIPFMKITKPILNPKEYAINQVRDLGYKAENVQNIIVTHLDLDHSGGLADFPNAQVHLHKKEYHAALNPRPNWKDKKRYQPEHWAHNPAWVLHEFCTSNQWFGFNACQVFPEIPDLLMVELRGHTEGHIGVAVRISNGENPKWLFHTGDAFMVPSEIDPSKKKTFFSYLMKISPGHGWALCEGFHETQARIKDIHKRHSDEIILVNSHSPEIFDQAKERLLAMK